MFSKFGKKFKFKENFIFNKTMLKTSSKKLGYKNNFGFSFSKQKKFFKKKIKKKNIFKKIKNLLFFLGLNSYCRVNNLFTRTNTVSLFNFKKANFLIINVYKRQFALKLQDVFISNYFNLTSCYFKGVNFFFCNYKKFYHFLFYYYFYNANCNYNCFLLNNFFKNLYNLRLVFDSYYKLSYVFYLSNRVFFFSDKPKKRLLSFYSGKGIKSQNKVKLRIKKWKNKVKPKFILFYLLVNVKLNLNPLAYLNKYKKTGKLIRSSKLKKRLAYKNLKNTLNLHYKWYLTFINKYKKKKYFLKKRRRVFKFKKFYHSQVYWKHLRTKIFLSLDTSLKKNLLGWQFLGYHDYFFKKINKFFNLRLFNHNKISLRIFFWKKFNIKVNYLRNFKKMFKVNSFYNFFLFFELRLDSYLIKLGFATDLKISRMFINCGYVFINFKVCQDIHKVVKLCDFIFLNFKKSTSYIYSSIKNQFFFNYTHSTNFRKKKKKKYLVKKTNFYKKLRSLKKHLITLKLIQFRSRLKVFNYDLFNGINSNFYYININLFDFIRILMVRRKLNLFLLNYKIFDVLIHSDI